MSTFYAAPMREDVVELGGDEPERLPGGFVNGVVRVGDTVRRSASPSSGFVHDLLRYLEHCQWSGAPRHLGFDDQGREMLTFLVGHVACEEIQSCVLQSGVRQARR
jgi:hypothetical protein